MSRETSLESNPDMNVKLLLSTAVAGAVVAAISYYYIKKYRSRDCLDFKDHFKTLACKLDKLAASASEFQLELKEDLDDTIDMVQEHVKNQMEIWNQEVKNLLFTKEMQEAMDTIQFVLDNLRKFDMEAKSYLSFTFIIMALVKKAQDYKDVFHWEENLSKLQYKIDGKQLERAQRLGQCAINIYPASWRTDLDSIGKVMGVKEEDILFVWFNDEPDDGHCPKFILFLDHENKALVLVVRGTFSLRDVVLDVVCDEEPFLEGFAHKGILSGARRILSKIGDQITSNLLRFPDYSLHITGHSLGAGTAELLVIDLLYGEANKHLLPGTEVFCIALAPPPVYRHNNTASTISLPIEIYINNYDCVPRMSLGSIARLIASMRAVDSLGLSLSQQFAILSSSPDNADDDVKSNLDKVLTAVEEARQDQFPFLQHPGTIYYLKKNKGEDKSQVVYQQESQCFSSSLYLLDNMVMDHLHTSYEEALQNVSV